MQPTDTREIPEFSVLLKGIYTEEKTVCDLWKRDLQRYLDICDCLTTEIITFLALIG